MLSGVTHKLTFNELSLWCVNMVKCTLSEASEPGVWGGGGHCLWPWLVSCQLHIPQVKNLNMGLDINLAVLLVCEFVEFFFINIKHVGIIFVLSCWPGSHLLLNDEVSLLIFIYIYILWKPPLERILRSVDMKIEGWMMLNK